MSVHVVDGVGLLTLTADVGGVSVAVALPDEPGHDVLAGQVAARLGEVEGWVRSVTVEDGVLVVDALAVSPRLPDVAAAVLGAIGDPALDDDALALALRPHAADPDAPVAREVRALAAAARDRSRLSVAVWGTFDDVDVTRAVTAAVSDWPGALRTSDTVPDAFDPAGAARAWTVRSVHGR